MDLNTSVSAIGFTVLVFTVLLCTLLGCVRRANGRLALPGPFPLPIIGNLHQLGALPHRSLQRLAEKYGPLMSIRLGSVPVVVASSSEAAKQFLKTHDLIFASRPPSAAGKYLFYNCKDIVFAPYGSYWRNMRKVCVLQLLTPKRIESFKGVREEEAWAMVRSIWEKSEQGRVGVNLSHTVSCYTSDLTWRILMGKRTVDRLSGGSEFEELAAQAAKWAGVVNIGYLNPCVEWLDLQGLRRRMKKVQEQLDAIFDKIIDEHVGRQPGRSREEQHNDDLVDVLVDMDGEITIEDKKAIIMDMFLGGIETLASALECAMSKVFRNPHVLNKLQEEINFVVQEDEKVKDSHLEKMEYLHCVLKETLRLHPIVPLLIRHESTEACIVEGTHHNYLIPTKARLIVNAWAIGRDPRVWEDPLGFKPERFVGKNFDIVKDPELRMIPFGVGRRSCPGFSMAIPTIEIALAYLFHYFNWRSEGELEMKEYFGATIPKKEHLFSIPTQRLRENAPSCLKME
ncbi:hypothetical protein SUGI_1029770 [Cryptomeria japonica]|uniref:cytochrome P450 750A1 n=1 Tax=Cryptomeria japonica TaxID=3369 RepID=UPI002414B678|nr:cytochrome P450 750A1 [Cryptomeria japonica]GLJ48828.1 hypothetical protein SUGI_1029770 [Cryptomeria japonica]